MAPQTPKKLLSNALENLSQSNLEKFHHELLDQRSGTRRVRRNQLEGKSILEVSDVMIQVFTEKEALKMAVDILRNIGCCQDADDLGKHATSGSGTSGPGFSCGLSSLSSCLQNNEVNELTQD